MRDYIVVTDADSDLPFSYVEEHQIPVFAMPFTLNGVEYLYDLKLQIPDFFDQLANGASVSTSARPYWEIKEFFKEQIDRGYDILYVALSNKLSAHYDNSCMAMRELKEEYPDARIEIVDTLSISLGQGQLVMLAKQLHDEAKTLDEAVAELEARKLHSAFFFMVDDLNYLRRGGRVSATSAFFGGLLSVKPILIANDEGQLIPSEKVSGRKKTLARIVELYAQNAETPDGGKAYLCVSNQKDAETVGGMLNERFPNLKLEICMVGPVIGGHVGPGVVGLVFFGNHR